MEDDRAQVDLGVAVDVEERLEEAAAQRQPKKRFVGRKAAEAASTTGTNVNVEDSGAIEGKSASHTQSTVSLLISTSS
jgi:2-(3-amino-3-carboxypropyl)histidine synthase